MSQHHQFESRGLPLNFGDGYLVAQNRLYGHVRQLALKNGLRFSAEANTAYQAFPLSQLEAILSSKCIPYGDNVSVLAAMSANQLMALEWGDIEGNLRTNYLFHEACHGVTRFFLPVPKGEVVERVFAMLLEESFSNACELLAVVDAEDAVHRIFYEMNSYITLFDHRSNLRRAVQELGGAAVMGFMVFAYLHANYLKAGMDEKNFQRSLGLVFEKDPPLAAKKSLRALAKIAFQLSERFRVQTTSFHLRLMGIQTPLKDLLSFDFLFSLERSSELRNQFLQHSARLGSILND